LVKDDDVIEEEKRVDMQRLDFSDDVERDQNL
jgi:hypothetical protein